MKTLVVGGGGREHAIVYALSKSPQKPKIYCAPGNAGTASLAVNVPISAENIADLIKFAREEGIDLVIVGPEAPLVLGLSDRLIENGIPVVGPTSASAKLEGSKLFAKQVMISAGIPTAMYESFTDAKRALDYVASLPDAPVVVKADGLAAGKGVVICENRDAAKKAIQEMLLNKAFGNAGETIVIEEFLEGEEASFIALTDGEFVLPLASSQDHKRLLDGDRGPNTGGMGAYSPAPVVTQKLHEQIVNQVMNPLMASMAEMGAPYRGVIYAGLMITKSGPKVLEFNVRFGDPETQAILPRLQSDIIELFEKTSKGGLGGMEISWDERPAVSIVLAAEGYPDKPKKGDIIEGIKEAEKTGALVLHAGTKLDDKGNIVTNGGRVLAVTAFGDGFKAAVKNAYSSVEKIHWRGMQYRKDIAHRATAR